MFTSLNPLSVTFPRITFLTVFILSACSTLQEKQSKDVLEKGAIPSQESVLPNTDTILTIEEPLSLDQTAKSYESNDQHEPELIEPLTSQIDTSLKDQDSTVDKLTVGGEESSTIIGGDIYIDTSESPDSLSLLEANTQEKNLWLRIKNGFNFPTRYPLENANNTQRVTRYLSRLEKSPHHFKGLAEKARPYLFYIVTELEKNNIPLEIALLPIVESRYDPFAYSPGRAAGLWQFIPSTGERFGLAQDWWQDERRDTIAATGAAIQYLLYLHNRFDNDWLLALAAYNAGQGNVAKAIRKNKKLGKATDYWSLDLPKETQHYVPQLLAWREFLREADTALIESGFIANEPYFDIVDVGSQIDLAEAANLANIDIDTLYQLNPSFSRWATDPQSPHLLLVPVANKIQFEQALETIPASQRITWEQYTVQKGDVLGTIAEKFSTSTAMITSTNQLKSNVIRIGQVLLIPSAKEQGEYYTKSLEQRLARTQNRARKTNGVKINHTVKAGETLWDIGKRYGVSANSIARWNNMAPKDVLSIKQKLVIWQKGEEQVATNSNKNERRKLFYRVKSGDSLSTIAGRFKVAVNDIKNWNQSARQQFIQPGQLLTLYVDVTNR